MMAGAYYNSFVFVEIDGVVGKGRVFGYAETQKRMKRKSKRKLYIIRNMYVYILDFLESSYSL